jgi:hypothetical protein
MIPWVRVYSNLPQHPDALKGWTRENMIYRKNREKLK